MGPDEPYARTLSTSRVGELDLRTDDSILEMADMMTNRAGRACIREFKLIEQALGLAYDPHTILFDLWLGQLSSLPVGPSGNVCTLC